MTGDFAAQYTARGTAVEPVLHLGDPETRA